MTIAFTELRLMAQILKEWDNNTSRPSMNISYTVYKANNLPEFSGGLLLY